MGSLKRKSSKRLRRSRTQLPKLISSSHTTDVLVRVRANYTQDSDGVWHVDLTADAGTSGSFSSDETALTLDKAFKKTVSAVESLSEQLDSSCMTVHLYDGSERAFIRLATEHNIGAYGTPHSSSGLSLFRR